MAKFWKSVIVVALLGMVLWGWITIDLIDSVRCLRMDDLNMSMTIHDMYERDNYLYGRLNILNETQIIATKRDLALAKQDDYIVGIMEETCIAIDRVNPKYAVNVGVSSVLLIYNEDKHGSGFFIDKANGIILTAGHITIHDINVPFHVRQDNVDVPVLGVCRDTVIDVGLIFIDPVLAQQFTANDVPISSRDAQIGDILVSAGYPLDPLDAPYASVGVVVGLDVNDANVLGPLFYHNVKFHLEIIFGMSGGPILNTSGEVVSLNSISIIGTQISYGPMATQIIQAVVRMKMQQSNDIQEIQNEDQN